MSSVFRIAAGEPIEVSAQWELQPQIVDISAWLLIPENAGFVRGSILDIGFHSRLGTDVIIQGEMLSRDFMGLLASLDVTLWLSIYPPIQKSEQE